MNFSDVELHFFGALVMGDITVMAIISIILLETSLVSCTFIILVFIRQKLKIRLMNYVKTVLIENFSLFAVLFLPFGVFHNVMITYLSSL